LAVSRGVLAPVVGALTRVGPRATGRGDPSAP
jgi:hypothetical protein